MGTLKSGGIHSLHDIFTSLIFMTMTYFVLLLDKFIQWENNACHTDQRC